MEAYSANLDPESSSIEYFFAYNDTLSLSMYEFAFRNSSNGEIYLEKPLNRSDAKLREMTIAAKKTVETDPKTELISYQYLNIKVSQASNFKPCFRQIFVIIHSSFTKKQNFLSIFMLY